MHAIACSYLQHSRVGGARILGHWSKVAFEVTCKRTKVFVGKAFWQLCFEDTLAGSCMHALQYARVTITSTYCSPNDWVDS